MQRSQDRSFRFSWGVTYLKHLSWHVANQRGLSLKSVRPLLHIYWGAYVWGWGANAHLGEKVKFRNESAAQAGSVRIIARPLLQTQSPH